MADKNIDDLLKELIGEFDFKTLFAHDSDKEQGVNLWLPEGYNAKYKSLQKESKKKFAKILGRVAVAVIDRGVEALEKQLPAEAS